MILFHTSDREIQYPDIHYGRKNADFGWGFYLTPDRDFTYKWARENAIVNTYEFEESGLLIHRFGRSREWFDYISHNRGLKDSLVADVIIGPIANDTIFDTLGIMNSGYLKPDLALRLLMIGPEYIQVAIKTEKAVKQLKWIRAERIDRADARIQKAEQEAYQRSITELFKKDFTGT